METGVLQGEIDPKILSTARCEHDFACLGSLSTSSKVLVRARAFSGGTMNPIKRIVPLSFAILACCVLAACTSPDSYDVILRNGTIYDGSGEKPYTGDVAV